MLAVELLRRIFLKLPPNDIFSPRKVLRLSARCLNARGMSASLTFVLGGMCATVYVGIHYHPSYG